jgi:hypothetical protein
MRGNLVADYTAGVEVLGTGEVAQVTLEPGYPRLIVDKQS